jgi:formylglycine-generating enzyme required for sulfatase activity
VIPVATPATASLTAAPQSTPGAETDTPTPPHPTPGAETDTPTPPHPTPANPTPGPRAGDIWTRPTDGAVMIYVPAGEFVMGSSDQDVETILDACTSCSRAWYSDEQPQHTVYLDAFWIDRTEVTNAQYLQCVEAGACRELECWGDEGFDAPNQPVVCVGWDDARVYAAWAGGRLPTEAEWEKAARGADGRTYPWGSSFDGTRLNFCDRNCAKEYSDAEADDGYAQTSPVGKYPAGASPYGALDMAGNAIEWVADWYEPDFYARAPSHNPGGPGFGEGRILRGGSYINSARNVRCAYRLVVSPHITAHDAGFRVVVDAGSPAP